MRNISDWRDFGRSAAAPAAVKTSSGVSGLVVITSRVQCCGWKCKILEINEGVKIRPSTAAARSLVNEGTHYLK